MKMGFKYLMLMGMMFSGLGTIAQEVNPGTEIMEVFLIGEVYRQAPNLGFDISVKYADSASPSTILEQLNGTYKIHNGMYWAMLDSTEYIQGNLYNVTVNYVDSSITVGKRMTYGNVMQMPLMDSVFLASFVDSLVVSRINDSTRLLKVNFKQGSAYRNYEIRYDLNSYVVRQIKFNVSDELFGTSDEQFSSGVGVITFDYSNYNSNPVSEDYFKESKYINIQGDQFSPQPAFSGYKVLVNLTN